MGVGFRFFQKKKCQVLFEWPLNDLEVCGVEGRQVGEGPVVLESDLALVDVPLREVLGVDPLW